MISFIFVLMMFACRIQLRILKNEMNQQQRLTKIGTALVCVLPMLPLINFPIIGCLILLFLTHIFNTNQSRILESIKLRKAHPRCISALTQLILSMQMGESFRTSLEKLIALEKDEFWKYQWRKIYESVVFLTQKKSNSSPFLRRFRNDLFRCDQVSFQQMDQLIEIRALYQKEFDFRRRSGQSLTQLRLQAFILFGLHIAVSLFMIHQFGWKPHKMIYLTSFFFMCIGLIVLLRTGKRVRWKV